MTSAIDHSPEGGDFRLGVLLGQRPDLLDALVDLTSATVVAVARDRAEPEAAGTRKGLPPERFRCWPERGSGARERRESDIAAWFSELRVDLVVAAGWLWLLSPRFLKAFPDRVINVHPALLPAFPGRHSVKRAVERGVRVHGVTVHGVDEGVDAGPILAQTALPVVDGAGAREVRTRLAPLECALLAEVVQTLAVDGWKQSWSPFPDTEGAEP